HIPWASLARSSPCRASARTRRAAARTRIWCCGRPERIGLRGHRLAHFRRAIRIQPGAGFTAKLFCIAHVAFPIEVLGSTLVTASRNSICLSAAHAAGAVVRARKRVYALERQRLKNKGKPGCG